MIEPRPTIISLIVFATVLLNGCEKKSGDSKTVSPGTLDTVNTTADSSIETGDSDASSSVWSEWEEPDITTEEILIPVYTETKPVANLEWEELVPGLEYTEAPSFIRCMNIGDNLIRIVRADLKKLKLKLLCADQLDTGNMTADTWCNRYHLLAVINAGMYGADQYSSTGFMKNDDYINNKRLNKAYKAIVVFNPVDNNLPYFQIIDTDCQPDWKNLLKKYRSASQGLRMIDCNRSNRWSKQAKYWSTACIGEDSRGHTLFIHSRTPYMVSDLNRILLSLPLDIRNVMYVEGGPESSLYVHADGKEIKSFGSYETDFYFSDDNDQYWPIPNVMAIGY